MIEAEPFGENFIPPDQTKPPKWYSYNPDNTMDVHTGSGLLILSRWPIVDAKFSPYPQLVGADHESHKGIAYAEINRNGHSIHVFTTHLQADPDPSPPWWRFRLLHRRKAVDIVRQIRARQVKHLRDFILEIRSKKLQSGKNMDDIIVCGDFNITSGTDEYFNLMRVLQNPRDLFCELACNGDIELASSNYTTIGTPPKRLDYVFAMGDPQRANLRPVKSEIRKRLFNGKYISDHYPVFVKFLPKVQ